MLIWVLNINFKVQMLIEIQYIMLKAYCWAFATCCVVGLTAGGECVLVNVYLCKPSIVRNLGSYWFVAIIMSINSANGWGVQCADQTSPLKLLEFHFIRRPRWSLGNVLVLRSKVHGFKPDWGRWIFSRRKNPEHKSSGRDFRLGVPSLRFQAC